MTNPDQNGALPLPPGKYKKITVRTDDGMVYTFATEPELHASSIGFYYISVPDESEPAGKRLVWQQRVDNGVVEGVKFTVEK
jgi:hypothetical protein